MLFRTVLATYFKNCIFEILFFQRWTANRQMAYEGGFQGRTNKLVDGCYSFWQGGAFPLIHMILSMHGKCTLYDTYSVSRSKDLARTHPACLLDRQFPENLLFGQSKFPILTFLWSCTYQIFYY